MTTANLTTEFEDRDGIRLIHVSGPLDSANHDSFKDVLDQIVNRPNFRVVIDCEKMTYINSRGIMLLARYQRATGQSVSFFGVAALNSRITRAIELLGMSNLVKPYATVEEALRSAAAL